MKKFPLVPGCLCIIKGSLYSDGMMVTAVRHALLPARFHLTPTIPWSIEDAWHIDPPFPSPPGLDGSLIPTRFLHPIGNPSEDEQSQENLMLENYD